MGQHPKWHAEQLNRYISDLRKSIHSFRSLDNYHTSQHFTSNDNANDRNGNNFLQSLSNTDTGNNIITSDSLSTLSTPSLLNQTHNTFTHPQQLHNFSSSFVERLSDAIQSALATDLRTEHANITTTTITNRNEHENDGSIISNYWLVLLIILYCVVVLGGIFGNASLIVTLFTQSSARLRNPLLVALCLADLLVTGVAAPLTVVALILDARNAITSILFCKLIHFMQVIFCSNKTNNKYKKAPTKTTHKIQLPMYICLLLIQFDYSSAINSCSK